MQFLYYDLLNYEYSFFFFFLTIAPSFFRLFWYSIFGMLRHVGLDLNSYLLSKLVTVPVAKAL